MSLLIIVNEDMTLHIDFKHLKENFEGCLVLLTTPHAVAKIKKESHVNKCDDVVFLNNFLEEDFVSSIQSLQKRHKTPSDDTKVITLEEQHILTLARVRERLKIAGQTVEGALLFTNKWEMKERISSLDSAIALPPYRRLDLSSGILDLHIPEGLTLPLFIKPIDMAGAQNSYRIHTLEEYKNVCQKLDKNHDYEVDGFIEGDLYHVDSLVEKGEVKCAYVSSYMFPPYESLSGKVCGSIVIDPNKDPDFYRKACDLNKRVLKALNAYEGVFHLEFFKTRKDFKEHYKEHDRGKIIKEESTQSSKIQVQKPSAETSGTETSGTEKSNTKKVDAGKLDAEKREAQKIDVDIVSKTEGAPKDVISKARLQRRETQEAHLEDSFIFLEVASRPAGGAVPRMLEIAYGVRLHEVHIILLMGDWYQGDFSKLFSLPKKCDAFWAYIPRQQGTVQALYEPSLTSNYEKRWHIKKGDTMKTPTSVSDRALELVVFSSSKDKLAKDYLYIKKTYQAYDLL